MDASLCGKTSWKSLDLAGLEEKYVIYLGLIYSVERFQSESAVMWYARRDRYVLFRRHRLDSLCK